MKSTLVTPEELEVIEELQARGIHPTPKLVREYLAKGQVNVSGPSGPSRAESCEGTMESKNFEDLPGAEFPTDAPSESEAYRSPVKRPKGSRRGRLPIDPPWYVQAAEMVANGLSLRRALWRLGIQLTERELQNVYRHVRFRTYLEEARIARWRAQWRKPRGF